MLSTIINAVPGAVAQGLIWGIMAIGLFITFKVLDFADLTVDGSICTGAVVCTVLVTNGMNVVLAMLIAFLVGMVAGAVTGALHTYLGIPPILSGILTQLMLWSVNLKILGKSNMPLSARKFTLLLTQLHIGKSILVILLIIAIIIALLYLFFGTELGCSIRATGNNEKMAKAQGIDVSAKKVIGLAISNGIVALSGSLLAQYQGFADINMGRGAIVIGLACIIIGNALFSKIWNNFAFTLFTCTLGGIIYYIVYQVIICLGFDTDLLKMLSALVVAIFLGMPYVKKRYFYKKNKFLKNEIKGEKQ